MDTLDTSPIFLLNTKFTLCFSFFHTFRKRRKKYMTSIFTWYGSCNNIHSGRWSISWLVRSIVFYHVKGIRDVGYITLQSDHVHSTSSLLIYHRLEVWKKYKGYNLYPECMNSLHKYNYVCNLERGCYKGKCIPIPLIWNKQDTAVAGKGGIYSRMHSYF